MKILHTSDWHLGRSLYGRKRYAEFEAFLNWLADLIEEQGAEALLVAGDVFDSSTPSNRAQELYYGFLHRVAASSCRHVVVIAGNHDSPTFLNAPQALLKALNVHVVGCACANLQDEVLLLRDAEQKPELIVCAVPYLRDRDIRVTEAGESIEDKEHKLVEGIRQHYAAVAELAEHERVALGVEIPIVAMGHLFTAGGQTLDGDGVRELYVGSLAHVTAAIFPSSFDYLALGHLHVPQRVSGAETIRYSGSPMAMGFGEAKQQKSLCLLELATEPGHRPEARLQLIDIPVFQALERVKGDWPQIHDCLHELLATQSDAWIEVIYSGEELIGDLRERLETTVADSHIEILRIKNERLIDRVLGQTDTEVTLDELSDAEVFERCLEAHQVPDEQRPPLRQSYAEIVASLHQEDSRAE